MSKIYNVLFFCTVNAARSILAGSLLNQMGKFRFRAYSAGFSASAVSPLSLATLQSRNLPTDAARSKSWTEFAAPGAPELDFVFTVCDMPPDELPPAWPGHPLTANGSLPDPAAVVGSGDAHQAVHRASDRTGSTARPCSARWTRSAASAAWIRPRTARRRPE